MRNRLLALVVATALIPALGHAQSNDLNVVPLYDVEQIVGPGATPLEHQRWTGLGHQSDPAAYGDLTTGFRPWSMSPDHLFRKVSGTGSQAENSIYSNTGTGGILAPPGGNAMATATDILMGRITPSYADQLLTDNYQLDNPGRFVASSTFTTPLTGADTVVFQLNITGYGPSAQEVAEGTYITSYTLTQRFSPVTLSINGLAPITGQAQLLSYNDSFQSLSHAQDLKNMGFVRYEAEEIWAFTFDLSSFTDPINTLEISFINYPHSSIRGLQTDVIATIPEPSTYFLLGAGILLLAFIRKRNTPPQTA